jgi:Arc/MetJ family transcription regulator
MGRTNIDIDEELVGAVMRRYGLRTKKDAVNFALRQVHVEPMTREEMLAMRGTGWDGDLDAMRESEGAELAEQWGWNDDAGDPADVDRSAPAGDRSVPVADRSKPAVDRPA